MALQSSPVSNAVSDQLTFVSEGYGNSEWAGSPDKIHIYLGPEWKKKITLAKNFIKHVGAGKMVFWGACSYEFYDEDGGVFEPEPPIGSCDLVVFATGEFRANFPFKHIDGELFWTANFSWEQGLVELPPILLDIPSVYECSDGFWGFVGCESDNYFSEAEALEAAKKSVGL